MPCEDDKQELEIALMTVQLEKLRAELTQERERAERDRERAERERVRHDHEMRRLDQDLRWEPLKALATILGGVAAMAGVILAVAHWIRP